MKKSRNRKNTIIVESDRGWLRLRLPRGQKRRYLYLNLQDIPEERAIAQAIADRKNQERLQALVDEHNVAINF